MTASNLAVTTLRYNHSRPSKRHGRAADAGFDNITFVQGDVTQLNIDGVFDAAVGRYILQFPRDPAAVLRAVTQHVRPGGVIAFLKQSWGPFVLTSAHVPLWCAMPSAPI
ncbi:MAG: class I SAM-dependent methyltransferase [bacterium]